MTWSQEISQLITDVDQLTSATNVKKSTLDASVASTEADKNAAAASITSATASFASAGANSTQAEAHKNTALAIYGTNAAQQTAVASVQASAALASGYAASGSAALQQDLSGIVTTLHRSPNAINSTFIYDTSKDSDGGAWTEKCQNTSWYNEPIMGKWLGPQDGESAARAVGGTLGSELVTNGDFSSGVTGWTLASGIVAADNAANLSAVAVGSSNFFRSLGFSPTINKVYEVSFTIRNYTSGSVAFRIDGQNKTSRSSNGTFTERHVGIAASANIGIAVNTIATLTIDNISVREVTPINTTSGDYFQLTTDGKFYRLWKNLYSNTQSLNSTDWRLGSGSFTTGVTDSNGGIAASLFSITTGSAAGFDDYSKRYSQDENILQTFSIYIKAPATNAATSVAITIPNGGGVFNLSTGALISGVGTTETLGNGWYRISTNSLKGNRFWYWGVTVTGSVGQGAVLAFPQLEYGGSATAYEAKAFGVGGTSEVFRGNKRDFPRLAGIVAEAANVTIYDLTEPGRPMWMRFASSGARVGIIGWTNSGSTMTSLAALNAQLMLGNSASGSLVNFASDSYNPVINGAYQINGISRLSERNNVITYTGVSGITNPQTIIIAGQNIYSVAMTVLPDAPTDPITGLRVPTIAVATNAGLSFIRHNGTVVSITDTFFFQYAEVVFEKRGSIVARHASTAPLFTRLTRYFKVPETNLTTTAGAVGTNGYSIDIFLMRMPNSGGTYKLLPNILRADGNITLYKEDVANGIRSLTATVNPAFNTGWMPGDIRRAYLSDTAVGSVTGPELVTNGTFNTDLSGWTASATWTWSSNGGGTAISTGTFGSLFQTIGVRNSPKRVTFSYVRTTARVQLSLIDSTAVNPTISFGGTPDIAILNGNASSGTVTGIIPAGYDRISFVTTDVAAQWAIDNVSVKEVVADRSYKAQGASINGTLTKSQLASGTSLVGYSGWSAANYLREPYSADLDFGTSEFSASAWINSSSLPRRNILTTTDNLSSWGVSNVTRTLAQPDPFGGNTAVQIITNSLSGVHALETSISTLIVGQRYTATYNLKGIGIGKVGVGSNVAGTGLNGVIAVDLLAGTFSGGPSGFINKSIQSLGNGWWRFSYQFDALQPTMGPAIYVTDASFNNNWVGDGTSGYLSSRAQMEIGAVATEYQPVLDGLEYSGVIFDRAAASGQRLRLVMNGLGRLTAEAFDGTTTRTVTTTTPYVTAPWLKAEANYTTDGSLGIRVNGREVVVTRGNPLLTLTNTSATLTVGNSFVLDAPFPGSIALLKLGATVPTPEQSIFMYEQEKQMFRANATSVLPDTGSIVDMSYDDVTDRWSTVSAANESYWNGLVRASVTPVPAGSYSKISTTSGIELAARITTNPGVDITIPAYVLREELVKRSEAANKLNRQTAIYDYIGGFTGNITTGSTAIASITNLTYPVSLVGARISGTGIPANTTITAVSGTTIYISAAATATTTGLVISFLDFKLPLGFETESVTTAGVVKQEGATKDYTRLFDGFLEMIRFAVAPGATTWVRIQASKSIQ